MDHGVSHDIFFWWLLYCNHLEKELVMDIKEIWADKGMPPMVATNAMLGIKYLVGIVLQEHVQKSSKWTAWCWTRPGHVLDIASIVSDHFRTWTPYERTEDGQYICSMLTASKHTN